MTNKKEENIDIATILTCRSANARANKQFEVLSDGKIRKISFNAGKFYTHQVKKIANLYELYELLVKLSKRPTKLIIRGKPKPKIGKMVRRKIHDPEAAFDPEPHHWVVFDIDKLPCPEHINPATEPEEAVKWVLEALPEPLRSIAISSIAEVETEFEAEAMSRDLAKIVANSTPASRFAT